MNMFSYLSQGENKILQKTYNLYISCYTKNFKVIQIIKDFGLKLFYKPENFNQILNSKDKIQL